MTVLTLHEASFDTTLVVAEIRERVGALHYSLAKVEVCNFHLSSTCVWGAGATVFFLSCLAGVYHLFPKGFLFC